MSWVDVEGSVRWTRADLENRARNELALGFPDAAELQQKVAEFAAGVGLMDADSRDRLDAFVATRAALRQQVEEEAARAQLVADRLGAEAAQQPQEGV